jgi:predicted nucleotidyltransferase
MQQNIDLIDLLRALNDEGAKYLIVGAYAFAFHGRPRATGDVDLFVGSDPANAVEDVQE